VDHGVSGKQTGASPERVKACLERFEEVPLLMEPGDAFFMHCNTSMHASGPNTSAGDRRYVLICCYNARGNSPAFEGMPGSRHPPYSPLDVAEGGIA